MGCINDALLKFTMVEDVTVSSDFESEAYDISGAESGFSIAVALNNGVATDVIVYLSVSSDGQNYARITDSDQEFQDTSGSVTFDVISSQTCFVKLGIEVVAGSIDISGAILTAKRRH